jgi:hypothetical protein
VKAGDYSNNEYNYKFNSDKEKKNIEDANGLDGKDTTKTKSNVNDLY